MRRPLPSPRPGLTPVTAVGGVFVLLTILLGPAATLTRAEPGDTTWVHTFHQDFINWATPHDSTFSFPDTTTHYAKVVLFYKIGCPAAPGDCDPWDRLGYLKMQHGSDWYEIARIVTPYDITPPPRPGTCTWSLDVSDYEPYLHGDVTLSNYIESWIGGNRGWLVTIDFAFIEGEPEWRPYQVVNLWQTYYTVYGDPDNPIESHLAAMRVPIDPAAERVKFRGIVTGHGQGIPTTAPSSASARIPSRPTVRRTPTLSGGRTATPTRAVPREAHGASRARDGARAPRCHRGMWRSRAR